MKKDLKIVIRYVKDFLRSKSLIFITTGIFLVLGLLTVLFTPKTFQSTVSFIPQVSENSGIGSGLKDIAAVIGFNLGKKDDKSKDLPVYLYPKIVSSLPYQRQLLETPLKFRGIDSMITYREYYTKVSKPSLINKIRKYTIGLPGLLIRSIRGKKNNVISVKIDSLEYMTKEESTLRNKLAETLVFTIDENDGTLIISTNMPQAVPAAQLAENAKVILQKEIINYRIKKAKEKYDFITNQYEEKKEQFIKAQNALAAYVDRNVYNITEQSKIRRQELQSQYTLISSVYAELEQQKLAQSIKIQEDTPLFTTLNPAIVPLEPANGGSFMIILKYMITGFIVSIFLYTYKAFYTQIKSIWNEV